MLKACSRCNYPIDSDNDEDDDSYELCSWCQLEEGEG